MRNFISGWIMVFLAVVCVVGYIYFADKWIGEVLIGWWLFAGGFFIAGTVMIMHEPDNKNQKGYWK